MTHPARTIWPLCAKDMFGGLISCSCYVEGQAPLGRALACIPSYPDAALALMLVGLLIGSVEGAAACGNGKLLFEDKFATLDPAWGFSPDDTSLSSGPEAFPGNYYSALNQSGLYDNYEVCVVFHTEIPANSGSYISVDFWGTDYQNYYSVDVFPGLGTYDVSRIQRNKLLYPIPARKEASIKGTSVTNEISVTLNGNKGTVVINGKKVLDFTGQPPEGGSVFGWGLGTSKNDTGPSTLTVKSIQVREVEAVEQQPGEHWQVAFRRTASRRQGDAVARLMQKPIDPTKLTAKEEAKLRAQFARDGREAVRQKLYVGTYSFTREGEVLPRDG